MSAARGAWAVVATLAPLACSTLEPQDQPAVIAAPTEASRAELRRVVTTVFNGQTITLAADALTRSSVLTLERREPAGPGGRIATGRTLEEPQRLELVLRGARCVLVRPADGTEWELMDAQCVPAGSSAR